MSTNRILEEINYTVSRDGYEIELLVEAVYTDFVKEVIPDGQLAGMMGHRPVRCTDSRSYRLYPAQARMLRDQLAEVLFGLEES